jgi:hypothetical protein
MNSFTAAIPKEESKKTRNKILLFLFLIFILRIIVTILITHNGATGIETSDTRNYVKYAMEIRNGHLSVIPRTMPGYPIIILLTQYLFPIAWLGTILLQQILNLLIAWLLVLIVRQYYTKGYLLVLAIFLFEPVTLIYSFSFMPEMFMLLFQVLATYVLVLAQKAEGRKKILLSLLSALLLSVGVFFKPILTFTYTLFVLFILIYYKDNIWKRILFVVLFYAVFQTPLSIYRFYLHNQFGVYALSRQEFSEKAGRSVDIKFIAQNHYPMSDDSLRKELRQALSAGGYDSTKPNWPLYAHLNDSITKANLRKYPFTAFYHSFAESYAYFQPGTRVLLNFQKAFTRTVLSDEFDDPQTASQNNNSIISRKNITALLSILYSALLIIPVLLVLFSKKLRKKYSQLLFLAVIWFLYTSVACGRVAQARYHVTFIWTFAMLAGIVYATIRESGIRSLFVTGKEKSHE